MNIYSRSVFVGHTTQLKLNQLNTGKHEMFRRMAWELFLALCNWVLVHTHLYIEVTIT